MEKSVRKRRLPRAHSLVLLMVALLLAGAERVTLVLDNSVELPAAGLKLRPLKDFALRPLPADETFTYENRATGERIEGYNPLALWRRDQHEALFMGEVGLLRIATVRHAPLGDLQPDVGNHVTNAAYQAHLKPFDEANWKDETFTAWVEGYSGMKVRDVQSELRGVNLRYPYRFYRFEGKNPNQTTAFLLKLPDGNGTRYVMMLFQIVEHYEVRNAARIMVSCVDSLRAMRQSEVNQDPHRRFQNRPSGDAESGRSAAFEETRQKVIANIRNLEEWWYVETENFVICSNMSRGSHRLVDAIQSDIEIVRKAYEELLPPAKPIDEVSVVRVFAEREEYLGYIPAHMAWSGGAWIPMRKELVISPLDLNDRSLSRELLLGVVYHEALHQYAHYAFDQRRLPTWFDEGHAAFFETAEVDRRRKSLEILENKRWGPYVDDLVKRNQHKFEVVVRLSPQAFYDEGREAHYALSWALVYFLRKAAPLYADRGYAEALDVVATSVRAGKSPDAASEAFLKALDMPRLQQDFADFWGSKTKRRRAERQPHTVSR